MLLGIALGACVPGVALAQPGQGGSPGGQGGGAGDDAQCMSEVPHDCPERCPSFDTCYVPTGDGRLYYRVGEQRFDCDGLDCTAALVSLGDYCCERGDFAPGSDDGCGCSLVGERQGHAEGAVGQARVAALGLGLVYWARRRGARRDGQRT